MNIARVGALLAIALLAGSFVLRDPGFAAPGNLAHFVERSAILGVLGLRMTIVVIAGGSDVTRGGHRPVGNG